MGYDAIVFVALIFFTEILFFVVVAMVQFAMDLVEKWKEIIKLKKALKKNI